MRLNLHALNSVIVVFLLFSLSGCGGELSTEPEPSSSSGTSPSSTSASSGETLSIITSNGYSEIPNGRGGFNVEAIAYTEAMTFDKSKSLSVFATTLYPHLRSIGCAACHSTETEGQAPIHSDIDVALAHEYALTRVNFKAPEHSKLVERLRIERHHCPFSSINCKVAADEMLEVIKNWREGIKSQLSNTPRSIAADITITDKQIEQWIEQDKSMLPDGEQKYTVYTSLHELHNDGLTGDELNIVRTALSKTLNTTARWAPEIVNPIDVTTQGILYKFDIRNYWGYNQGITDLLFGGSANDLAGFSVSDMRDYQGNIIDSQIMEQRYNFTGVTERDDEHALRIWERVLHGNIEGESGASKRLTPNIQGFKGPRKTNSAGEYADIENIKWVEAAQLIYTLSRPDVYNTIMMNPFYADELEESLGVPLCQDSCRL